MSREHTLTASDQALLSDRVDQFHDALAAGPVADWEPYLFQLPKGLRKRVLVELAAVHMAHEWRAGRRPAVEDYLKWFPELGTAAAPPPQLVFEEYRCLLACGGAPAASGYSRRFPVLFPAAAGEFRRIEQEAQRPTAESTGPPLRGYTKIVLLGKGGFADVWLVRNATGKGKALKIVRDRMSSDAAQREMKALEQVKNVEHNCLLRTEDYWIENQRLHILCQLAEGSLTRRMGQCQQELGTPGIPLDELFQYLCDAAWGLDYLHARRITHRDVKPDNILLVGGGAVLADFGLARQQNNEVTQQSVFAGSPPYMAPETFGGEVSPASDQYSLALTYAHLRQGQHPLKLLPFPQIMHEHLSGVYDLSEGVMGPDERAVLLRALDQTPANRFPTCQALAVALGKAIGLPYRARGVGDPTGGSGPMPALSPPSADSLQTPPILPQQDTQHPHTESFLPPSPPAPPRSPVLVATPVDLHSVADVADEPDASPGPSKVLPRLLIGVAVLAAAGVIVFLATRGSGGSGTGGDQPNPDPVVIIPPPLDPPPGTGKQKEIAPPTGNQQKVDPPIPPKPVVLVPTGFKPDGADKVQTVRGDYAKWVKGQLNGQEVRFRFIPPTPTPKGQTAALYIMEQKVWNALYARTGAGVLPLAPAVQVSQADAAAFAAKFPGGRLPTATEWDVAAGVYQLPPPPGVTKAGGQAIVNVAAPTEPGTDIGTAHDLFDLAGNGAEWTADLLPGDPPRAVTRGRNFLFATPLTFKDLEAERTDPKAAFADKGNRYTGFRVVVPAPTGK